ncbi:hypothetical protein ACFL0P_05490 [Candidatus Omnitrophota bacterium]
MRDRLFIFLTCVLMLLFLASVAENIFSHLESPEQYKEAVVGSGKPGRMLKELLIGIEEAGLKPYEAKYYKVIDE